MQRTQINLPGSEGYNDAALFSNWFNNDKNEKIINA